MLNIIKFLSLSGDTLDLKYTLIYLKKECYLLATLRGMVNKIRKAIAKIGKGTLLNLGSHSETKILIFKHSYTSNCPEFPIQGLNFRAEWRDSHPKFRNPVENNS